MRKLQANDFEVGFLEGWRDASQITLIGHERPVFTPNLQVHREPVPDEPLEQFVQQQRAELSTLDGFRLIDHGDRMLGGVSVLQHSYSWNLPNQPDARVQQHQLICARGGALYTVTCSALEHDWSEVEAGFEMALAAFAWK